MGAGSEQLAREVVYLDGKLRGATKSQVDADKTLLIPDVPEGYAVAARELARKRITLAGYRMADRLSEMFGP